MSAVAAALDVQPTDHAPDPARLQEMLGRAITESSAAMQAGLVVIGDRLGLYRALAENGPMRADELARLTGTTERYVQEWLNANAASQFVEYLPRSGRYRMTPEQAAVFAFEESPAFMVGGFETAISASRIVDRLEQAFRTGEGIGWGEHHAGVFTGCERFYRSGYIAHLLSDWIPALDGMQARLEAGAQVADIGCGHGAATIMLAQAFPNSRFTGYDSHPASVQVARERAEKAGVAARVRFEVATAADYRGRDFDLVTIFDALHDMGDPAGAAAHVLTTLKPDGIWMIVEPNAGDTVEENLHPLGRAFYAASALMCTPCAIKQGRVALGAQAGEARLRAVVTGAGFSRWRRAAQTPVNLVLEARP